MRLSQPTRKALLLIDVINDFDFPDSAKLLRFALPAARRLAKLKARLKRRGVRIIYVNDNFGRWNSDFRDLVDHCTALAGAPATISKLLLPAADEFFVLKPKHSGFYSSSLEILLRFLKVETLIVSGFAGDICVLYTANDAYMRDYAVIVPSDCIASETASANVAALRQMKRRLKARLCLSEHLR